MFRYSRVYFGMGYFLFGLILLSGCSKNYFEGKILYQYQYLDKQGKDITTQIKSNEDAEQHYFINAHNYKSKNERGELTQLYNASTNQYYFNVGLELQVVDAAKEFPKEFQFKAQPEKQTILGRPCRSLLMTSEIGPTTYFYSKKVRVNAEPFSKHRFGNWNRYLNETKGALPLKFVMVSERYTLVATAIQVTPMKLADDDFEVKKALAK